MAYSKHSNMLGKYGITMHEYDKMYLAQKGRCAICGKLETGKNAKGGIKALSVDHDHKTDEVRGLLCVRCNTGLGYFQDNPDVLLEAAHYVKNYKYLMASRQSRGRGPNRVDKDTDETEKFKPGKFSWHTESVEP